MGWHRKICDSQRVARTVNTTSCIMCVSTDGHVGPSPRAPCPCQLPRSCCVSRRSRDVADVPNIDRLGRPLDACGLHLGPGPASVFLEERDTPARHSSGRWLEPAHCLSAKMLVFKSSRWAGPYVARLACTGRSVAGRMSKSQQSCRSAGFANSTFPI